MHPLLKFHWEKVDREVPVNANHIVLHTIEDVLIVNLDAIYERTYGYRAIDQLLYLIYKFADNKRLIFLSRDGANLQLAGIKEIIVSVIQCLGLNEETCLVIGRENVEIPGATVEMYEAIPFWCSGIYEEIKSVDILDEPLEKKFAAWYHRGPFFRLLLARHLYDNYKEDSYISYQETYDHGMIHDHKLRSFFKDELEWCSNYTPIVYDQLFQNRQYTLEQITNPIRKPYGKYFVDIVAETDVLSTTWITEKTVRNLYTGVPFIAMGGPGILEKIRSFGFKTFAPYINEDYDNNPNLYQRLEQIKKEIDRIAQISYDELRQIKREMMPILEHNQKIFIKFAKRYGTRVY